MSVFSSRRRRSRRRSFTGNSISGLSGTRRRRKGGGLSHMLFPLFCVVVVLGGVAFGVRSVSGIREKSRIEDVVGELRYACQNMDADALLSIVNPNIADPLRMAAAVTNTNKNELMADIFSSLGEPVENVDLEQVLRSLTYEIRKIQVSGRYARVTAQCTLTVNGEIFSREATLELEQIEKKWYIMSADLDLGVGD